MNSNLRAGISILLSQALILSSVSCAARTTKPQVPLQPAVFNPLREALQKSYLDLFKEAPTLEFSPQQIEQMREYLKQSREYCVDQFKEHAKEHDKDLERVQARLKSDSARLNESQRHELHCQIQNLRALKSQAEVLANQAIPVAYENKSAKLELIEKWPDEFRAIKARIEDGSYHSRQWGDVKDIGFREVGKGQEEDVKDGQEAIRQMKQAGLLPPEVENQQVRDYVRSLAEKIAAKSDLRVPVKVTVLNSKEVNAFALPGGFLFIQRGLLESAEDESQLAGVIAHEIAHAAARHGNRLMKRATVSSIIYQAAQIAALVLTGGAVGVGAYYALQYGFYGLGLVLSLNLLGVSREFELEADQLGVQYAWNSGYDTSGFIRFFDKMATREGYVNGASWFRTHPPFYSRMVKSQEEILYLPKKEGLIQQSTAFKEMKKELEKVSQKAKEEEKDRPSLLAPEKGCPPPEKIEYQPGQPIETLCRLPQKIE
ncbi:MAG: M48 family metalloprotease [Acidobacteriota bacterium]